MWIDSNYSFEPIQKLSIFESGIFESQFIKLKTSKNKFCIVGNIYRPNTAPKANIQKFNDILNTILQSIRCDNELRQCQSIELLGDFNIDLLKHGIHSDTTCYLDTVLNYSLLPLITLPTRVCHNSATIIDHILSNAKDDEFDTGIIISVISDHLPVFYIKHGKFYRPPQQYIKTRKINEKTISALTNLLSKTSWESV